MGGVRLPPCASSRRIHRRGVRREPVAATAASDGVAAAGDGPGAVIAAEAWAWKPGADEFIPDLTVFDDTDEDVRYTGTPHLAVEILSTDRAAGLLRKAHKYAAAGLVHYWVVDPAGPEIIEFRLGPGAAAYTEVARHTGANAATLDIGVAQITVTPADLLP